MAATTADALVAEFPDLFDDTNATERKKQRMKAMLVKSHFLVLKADLELFLHLFALECWRVKLLAHVATGEELSVEARKRIRKSTLDASAVLAHADAIEAVAATLVPIHGLNGICSAAEAAGVDVRGVCKKADPKIWPQTFTAFQVRHIIEHRNGRVDADFRAQVHKLWGATTWGKRPPSLDEKVRVEVTKEDLLGTAKRMLSLVDALRGACEELDVRRRELADRRGEAT